MTRHLYIVDDDNPVRLSLEILLSRADGFSIRSFKTGDAFLDALGSLAPGVLLLDMHMPGASGLDVLNRLESRHGMRAILITGQADDDLKLAILRAGAVALIEKPFDHRDLLKAIERAFKSLGA